MGPPLLETWKRKPRLPLAMFGLIVASFLLPSKIVNADSLFHEYTTDITTSSIYIYNISGRCFFLTIIIIQNATNFTENFCFFFFFNWSNCHSMECCYFQIIRFFCLAGERKEKKNEIFNIYWTKKIIASL